MSYVLDALKKADAERERGSVPGLHAQPMPSVLAPAEAPRAMARWAWLLAGAGLVALAVAGWVVLGHGGTAGNPPLEIAATPPGQSSMSSTTTAPQLSAAPATPAQIAPNPAREAARPAVPTAPPAAEPQRAAVASPQPPVRLPAPAPSPAVPTSPQVHEVPAPAAPSRPSASSQADDKRGASSEGRILALNELPEDVRRALPPLNVGSSMYSENPSSRFIMINGQIYHENDQLAPDLTLEQIRLKLAVLRYKDLRFRLMY